MPRWSHLLCLAVAAAVASRLSAQTVRPQAPATGPALAGCVTSGEGDPGALLARAAAAIGIPEQPGLVLRIRGARATLQAFQSDRSYPPFFSSFAQMEAWYDPMSGAERVATHGVFPGSALPAFAALTGSRAAWFVRDTAAIPAADFGAGAARMLNPWAVLGDFRRSADLEIAGRCRYRDYSRIALIRTGPHGAERLLLDAKTFVPVALLRDEQHFLWGQSDVEYVWSNWSGVTPSGLFPLSAFRTVDGEVEISETVSDLTLLASDSAPRLSLPDTTLVLPARSPAFYEPEQPDTARIGRNAWLIRNRFYTIAAVLARDTVFVLDATLSEARARQDSVWIGKLFPGRHPIVLVVTDLAWPHIGGVRFWVANGATVVSHRASREFLERVVERRWTREPDLLEQRRPRVRFTFREVDDSLRLADGDLVLHPIDGISSEGALVAWVPRERFLWASDYVQNLRRPTEYAREVLQAVRRVGVEPARFAAQHVGLTPWRVVDSLHPEERVPASPAAGVVKGDRLRTGVLARRGSVTTPSGATRDLGDRSQRLSVVTWRGKPALVSVQTLTTSRGTITDSSVNDLASLAPLRHSSSGAGRTMELEFDGAAVQGRYTGNEAAPLAIEQRFSAAPYDSNIFDLVVAALPLADGYSARLPMYVYEQGGLVWWTARVAGAEQMSLPNGATADVWVVDIDDGGQRRARLWIRKAEREVVRSTYYISPGVEYTITAA